MKGYLKKLPREIKDLIYLAADIAAKNNMPVYLVGGFVRDLILGVKNLDLDIAVEGDGIKFAGEFAGILKAKFICHRRFGTATVSLRHNLKIDVASARKEIYPQPASLPLVKRGSLKDDLGRRDFTINAMAISIQKEDFGKLIDFFGGQSDLNEKKIRILHPLSFIDDPTRILRAIRFAQRYNFKIEPKTLAYLKEAIRIEMFKQVKPQRLRDELILILKEEKPLGQIKRIQELAGFDFICPGLTLTKSTRELLCSVKNQISWFRRDYPERRRLDVWLVYFMGLMDFLAIRDVKSICKKFALRKGEEKRILSYKKINRKFILELSQTRIKPSKIFSLLEPLSYEVIILIKAKYTNRNVQKHIEDFLAIYNGLRLEIGGDDLQRLGVSPGPYYRKIFTLVLKAKLEGKIKTREEELALIKKLINK